MMTAAGYRVSAPVTIARQKSKDTKLLNFYKQFHDELSLLSNNLRKLVASLPRIQAELKDRLLAYDSKAWEEGIVEEALEQRLGDLQQPFIYSLQEILRALEDIVSTQYVRLEDGEAPSSPIGGKPIYKKLKQLRAEVGKNKEGFRERWRFTSKEVKLRKSLKILVDRNQYLERLLHQSNAPVAVQDPVSTTVRAPPPRKICDLATTLHSSLVALSSCSCHAQHEARLCVNVPFDTEAGVVPTRLDLYLSMPAQEAGARWQESHVHVDIDIQPEVAVTSPSSRVRFDDSSPVERGTKRRRRSSMTEMSSMEQISAMCNLVDRAYHNGANTELLLNGQALWHIKSTSLRRKVPEPKTLNDLLRTRKLLSRRNRHRLAVILANALLHLKDSEWLQDRWSKEEVHFMHMSDGSTDIKRPYVAVALDGSGPPQTTAGADDSIHECPPLLSLGIMLLELGISESLQRRQLKEDLVEGVATANTDFLTALRVLDESVDDLHDRYRAAVDACLNCHFLDPDIARDFSNEAFQSLVYNNIVVPLEDELLSGWNDKPEDLWNQLSD
ncbi:hypothetical protein LTS14_007759 [Recurvomyces mirabilis]|nr:hypothetical protein LTS14_007759 [Recurvomyces mirabilis]